MDKSPLFLLRISPGSGCHQILTQSLHRTKLPPLPPAPEDSSYKNRDGPTGPGSLGLRAAREASKTWLANMQTDQFQGAPGLDGPCHGGTPGLPEAGSACVVIDRLSYEP